MKFTAEQLALVGIKSPLVEFATNVNMVDPTQATINPSARIDKGDCVCVSSFVYWRHGVTLERMLAAVSLTPSSTAALSEADPDVMT
jgi:hypothetical protein